ncbi:MAG: T9SS type A sorting domain-containing protein [Sphingobacteriaceae bacterium]
MKKVIVLFLLLVSFISKAQLPFLNASTGNAGEFPIDKDTNLYMFHGNRLVKTDKNFNTIWAKTYSGITYSSLLLSKTGSIFFTSGSKIGKINSSDGNLVWCKELNGVSINNVNIVLNFNRLLLDHNDHLLATAYSNQEGIFFKIDTNGTFIKLRSFPKRYSSNFTILSDSAGIYKFLDGGEFCLCPPNSIFITSYSDVTNNIISYKEIFTHFSNYNTIGWGLYKSKFNNSFYLSLSNLGPSNLSNAGKSGIAKFNSKGDFIWQSDFSGFNGLPNHLQFTNSLIEDQNGKLNLSLSTGSYFMYSTGGIFSIDSMGVSSNTGSITYSISTQSTFPNNSLTKYSLQNIYGSKCYFDIVTNAISDNPLIITPFQSSVQNSCAITGTAITNSTINSIASSQTSTLISVPSITVFSYYNYIPTVSNITFSVNLNYCTLLSTSEIEKAKTAVSIHPNPTSNILKFDLSNSTVIEEVHVLDVNGKIVKTHLNCKEISVSDIALGIYFLQLKSDGQLYYSKFIKK